VATQHDRFIPKHGIGPVVLSLPQLLADLGLQIQHFLERSPKLPKAVGCILRSVHHPVVGAAGMHLIDVDHALGCDNGLQPENAGKNNETVGLSSSSDRALAKQLTWRAKA